MMRERNTLPITRYGQWALVTGAARQTGLGYSFARRLARAGMHIVLVDIEGEALESRASELRSDFGVGVRAVALDLGRPDFMVAMLAELDDVEIGLLVCNHVYSPDGHRKILDVELDVLQRMLEVNALAYTTLLHTFGNQMRVRGCGALIVVASGGGLMPAPYVGPYSANKAYQISLGESLWYELRGSGVDVAIVPAGVMKTQEAVEGFPNFLIAAPDDVVDEVLANLGRKHLVVPTRFNKALLTVLVKLMPRSLAVRTMGRFIKYGLPEQDR